MFPGWQEVCSRSAGQHDPGPAGTGQGLAGPLLAGECAAAGPGPSYGQESPCSGDAGRGQTRLWLQFLSLISDGVDPPWTLTRSTQPTSSVSRALCLPKASRSPPPKDKSQGFHSWEDKSTLNLTAEQAAPDVSLHTGRLRGPRGPHAPHLLGGYANPHLALWQRRGHARQGVRSIHNRLRSNLRQIETTRVRQTAHREHWTKLRADIHRKGGQMA